MGRFSYSSRLAGVVFFVFAVPAVSQIQNALNASNADIESPSTASLLTKIPRDQSVAIALPILTIEQTGDILQIRGEYQAAIAAYAKVAPPSAAVWNKIGIAYQLLYDPKDAAQCYKEALKLESNNIPALNNLATILDSLQNYSSAERLYRKALRIEPGSAVILKNLGTNLLMQHEYRRGSEAYTLALKLDPHVFDESHKPSVNDPAPTNEHGTVSYFKARNCARAGLSDCAIAHLREAFNQGSATVERVTNERDFDELRDTPELQRLLVEEQ